MELVRTLDQPERQCFKGNSFKLELKNNFFKVMTINLGNKIAKEISNSISGKFKSNWNLLDNYNLNKKSDGVSKGVTEGN